MTAADGRKRLTDVADTEQLLRIIQSIPSPKAEPFKLWLAQVGWKRMEETIGPEQAIDRALETYLKRAARRSGSTSACWPSVSEMSSPMSGTSGRGEGPGVRHPYRRHLPGGVARGPGGKS